MRNFITRVTAWSSVAVILSLNFSYAALAVTTPTQEAVLSSYTDNLPEGLGVEEDTFVNFITILDTVIEPNGDMHLVGMDMDTDFDNDQDLVYLSYNYGGDTWSSATTLAANINTDEGSDDKWDVSAKLALNSAGNPAVVYELTDFNNATTDFHKETHYIQYNGSSWDADRTVDTYSHATTSPTSGTVDLEFYWGTNHPTIFTCNDISGGVYQYKTTDQFASSIVEEQVSTYFCSSVDAVIDSQDDIFVVTGDHQQDKLRAFENGTSTYSTAGVWDVDEGDGTIMTNMDAQDDSYLKAVLIGDDTLAVAVRVDSAAAEPNDAIAYLERNGGTWTAPTTAVSGVQLDQDSKFDITWDTAEGIPYIGFANLGSNEFRVAYDAGTGFVNELVSNAYTFDAAMIGIEFNSQADPDRLEYLFYQGSSAGIPSLEHWSVNNLATFATTGGGPGEGVPEFSTYVYIATMLALFGLVYKRNPEAFAFLANR